MASLNSYANFLYYFNLAQGPCGNLIYEKESGCRSVCEWGQHGRLQMESTRDPDSPRPGRCMGRAERCGPAPPAVLWGWRAPPHCKPSSFVCLRLRYSGHSLLVSASFASDLYLTKDLFSDVFQSHQQLMEFAFLKFSFWSLFTLS